MNACALAVSFTSDEMHVSLKDGRMLWVPLSWFPALERASSAQRHAVEISPAGAGLHWPQLDEDISVDGLLSGRRDTTRRVPRARTESD